MKTIVTAARLILTMTLITGLVYPLTISAVARIFFPDKAVGSPISKNGVIVGSELIGQQFAGSEYFRPRPSATKYDPRPSGGSNLGPTSAMLREMVAQRRAQLQGIYGVAIEIPPDLLFASASGLDPHISPEAARYQADQIIKMRNLDLKAKTTLFKLIDEHIEYPTLGLLGEPRVNVLKLNLALDSLAGVLK